MWVGNARSNSLKVTFMSSELRPGSQLRDYAAGALSQKTPDLVDALFSSILGLFLRPLLLRKCLLQPLVVLTGPISCLVLTTVLSSDIYRVGLRQWIINA